MSRVKKHDERPWGAELVQAAAVQGGPTQGGAALAGGARGGEDAGRHGEVEVSRRRHDAGVVAAELEQRAAEATRDPFADRLANAPRTGSGVLRHASCACCARATAASTAAPSCQAICATVPPVTGVRTR